MHLLRTAIIFYISNAYCSFTSTSPRYRYDSLDTHHLDALLHNRPIIYRSSLDGLDQQLIDQSCRENRMQCQRLPHGIDQVEENHNDSIETPRKFGRRSKRYMSVLARGFNTSETSVERDETTNVHHYLDGQEARQKVTNHLLSRAPPSPEEIRSTAGMYTSLGDWNNDERIRLKKLTKTHEFTKELIQTAASASENKNSHLAWMKDKKKNAAITAAQLSSPSSNRHSEAKDLLRAVKYYTNSWGRYQRVVEAINRDMKDPKIVKERNRKAKLHTQKMHALRENFHVPHHDLGAMEKELREMTLAHKESMKLPSTGVPNTALYSYDPKSRVQNMAAREMRHADLFLDGERMLKLWVGKRVEMLRKDGMRDKAAELRFRLRGYQKASGEHFAFVKSVQKGYERGAEAKGEKGQGRGKGRQPRKRPSGEPFPALWDRYVTRVPEDEPDGP